MAHPVVLLADQYPRSAWFVGLGAVAVLSFLAAVACEVYLGGNSEPYAGALGGLGVMLFVGLSFSAPIALAHWAFSD